MRKIIYSPKYSLYNLGNEHPFSPLRAEITIDLLKKLNLFQSFEEPEILIPEELEGIHDPEYIKAVERLSSGSEVPNSSAWGLGTQDNPIVPNMAEGARAICGGTLKGANEIINGTADKVLQFGGGFHHAHYGLAAGFCIYSDLALAIKKMTASGMHVLYLDIDVHHGDGVQELFYSDENVMTVSFHESGEYLFPGSGWIHELGNGMGKSLSLNIPLEPFTEGDSFLNSFDAIMEPALSWFRPNAIVVQCGADSHFSDPLADLMLTTYDFEILFKKIFDYADKYANGKALFTLGGGYSISATSRIWAILYLLFTENELPIRLPKSWITEWREKTGIVLPENLHDPLTAFNEIPRKAIIEKQNKDIVRRLLDAVSYDWM